MGFCKKEESRHKELLETLKMVDNKRIEYLANLGGYSTKTMLRRFITVSIVALIIFTVASIFTETELPYSSTEMWKPILFLLLAFNSVSETNILMARVLNRFSVLKGRFVPLSAFFLLITTLMIVFWVKMAQFVLNEVQLLLEPMAQLTMLFGVIMLFIMHIMIMMSNITREWMESLKEIDRLKSAKLQSDYSSLQDRLNPHFLFNNLSVLRSLIRYDADAAEKFTENFTDVYRYVLRSHENRTVSLASELKFLDSYIALHKERLGDGIHSQIHVCDKCLNKELPPMSVQLLVENAIKHNVASRNNPLTVEIFDEEDVLIVKNRINKKETTYSTQTGLKTLQAQVQMVTGREMEVIDDGEYYEVKLPLL